MRRLLFLVGLAAVLACAVPAAEGNVGTSPGSTPSLPGALVWGNGVFTSRSTFEKWLHRRSQTLTSWRRLHPRALRILLGAEAPPVHFQPSQFAPRKSPRPLLSGATPEASTPRVPIAPIVVVLGLLLVALAALPFPVVAPEWAPGAVMYHHRITLLIVGATLVGAIAIVRLTG